MAQFGRALRSGRRGRVFESRRLDQKKHSMVEMVSHVVLFILNLYFKNIAKQESSFPAFLLGYTCSYKLLKKEVVKRKIMNRKNRLLQNFYWSVFLMIITFPLSFLWINIANLLKNLLKAASPLFYWLKMKRKASDIHFV